MELDENGFLEELLALRREPWENMPSEMGELCFNGGSLDCFPDNPHLSFEFTEPSEPIFSSSFSEVHCPFPSGYSFTENGLSQSKPETSLLPSQEDCMMAMEAEGVGLLWENLLEKPKVCNMELNPASETPALDMSSCIGRKGRVKKVEGQPSKNLMAERRRRKRLNDRLSMLRSVVPKISKMDRTSILGDTIDYMKELLGRIKTLQEEIEGRPDELKVLTIFKELEPNEVLVSNTPKFDVERRSADTRIEICCASKPGLLLSTVNTLEALGLEIQQCVISCFSDFGMQASCSEELEQRAILSSEEVKQALFRNAGYGGRCM